MQRCRHASGHACQCSAPPISRLPSGASLPLRSMATAYSRRWWPAMSNYGFRIGRKGGTPYPLRTAPSPRSEESMRGWLLGVPLVLGLAGAANAADLTATVYRIGTSGTGEALGTVTVSSGDGGVVFTTDLRGLPAGQHGFHVHANGDCGPGPNDVGLVVAGGAAGSHWDPEGTEQHRGPQGGGHLGDLPAPDGAGAGTAKERLPAPRITDLARLKGRTLVTHAGDDNYADHPSPLGGGAGRIACGVIR